MSLKHNFIENQCSYEDEFWNNLNKLRFVLAFTLKTPTVNEGIENNKDPATTEASCMKTEIGQKSEPENKEMKICVENSILPCTADLLKKIEKILQDCVNQASLDKIPTIAVPNRKIWSNTTFDKNCGVQMNPNPLTVSVGRSASINSTRVKRFGQTLHLLSKVHFLLNSNTFCTKRELYYQDVKFYGSQSVVDHILNDLSCLLGVQKIQLHVLTTSKGCIAGDLQFKDADGNHIDCSKTSQGLLVPNNINGITCIYSEARFILLVEKDAVFQMLLESNILQRLHPCILITGKGFPDANTRQLTRKLWDNLQIPILALVDADPYGIEILCIYTYGSLSLSFDVKNLAVPQIRWLGILPSDIQKLQLSENAVLEMNEHDIKKANSLLTRSYMQSRPEWCQQVKFMLSLKKKAEIECLSKINEGFLTNTYLPNKIKYGGWI